MQELLNAIIIGLVQGLTEFLPVSSSGHLVLSQYLLGVEMPGMTFEIFLHFGTLISVFWVFRRRLWKIILSFVALFKKDEWAQFTTSTDRWFGLLLVLGCIPTALIGFALEDYVTQAFDSVKFVGIALLVTGILLWIADALPGGRMDKRVAAEYSFLLSAPVILGATLLEVYDLISANVELAGHWTVYLLGVTVSALAGIFAINFFIKLLVNNKLRYFSIYCWIVGLVVIVFL